MNTALIYTNIVALVGAGMAIVSMSSPAVFAPTLNINIGAWFFPICEDNQATSQIHRLNLDVISPQWGQLGSEGELKISEGPCDAFTPELAKGLKRYSSEQYINIVNISDIEKMRLLINNQDKIDQFIDESLNFVNKVEFTGVEIDFEGYAKWTREDMEKYIDFCEQLISRYHEQGKQVRIDMPAYDATYKPEHYNYEQVAQLNADGFVVMLYEEQWGKMPPYPVSTNDWIQSVTKEVFETFGEKKNKIIAGINSYGYKARQNTPIDVKIDDYITTTETTQQPGISSAQRDYRSGDLYFKQNGVYYYFSDVETMQTRVALIKALGYEEVSVWRLGGGHPWFY